MMATACSGTFYLPLQFLSLLAFFFFFLDKHQLFVRMCRKGWKKAGRCALTCCWAWELVLCGDPARGAQIVRFRGRPTRDGTKDPAEGRQVLGLFGARCAQRCGPLQDRVLPWVRQLQARRNSPFAREPLFLCIFYNWEFIYFFNGILDKFLIN